MYKKNAMSSVGIKTIYVHPSTSHYHYLSDWFVRTLTFIFTYVMLISELLQITYSGTELETLLSSVINEVIKWSVYFPLASKVWHSSKPTHTVWHAQRSDQSYPALLWYLSTPWAGCCFQACRGWWQQGFLASKLGEQKWDPRATEW